MSSLGLADSFRCQVAYKMGKRRPMAPDFPCMPPGANSSQIIAMFHELCLDGRGPRLELHYDNLLKPFTPFVYVPDLKKYGRDAESLADLLPHAIVGNAFLHVSPEQVIWSILKKAGLVMWRAVVTDSVFGGLHEPCADPIHQDVVDLMHFLAPSLASLDCMRALPISPRRQPCGIQLGNEYGPLETDPVIAFAAALDGQTPEQALFSYIRDIVSVVPTLIGGWSQVTLILPDGMLFYTASTGEFPISASANPVPCPGTTWWLWSDLLSQRAAPTPRPLVVAETAMATSARPGSQASDDDSDGDTEPVVMPFHPLDHNRRGLGHTSDIAARVPGEMCEYTNPSRIASALQWPYLHPFDARVLKAMAEKEGKWLVDYKPSAAVQEGGDDGEQPDKKRAKVKKMPIPFGLWDLSPGVRQFVLRAGTICVDVVEAASFDADVRENILHAMAFFFRHGVDMGLLPLGVRLLSIVPEGLLVRGFLNSPETGDVFDALVKFVQQETEEEIEPRCVDLAPGPGAEHPLAGDFRLYTPVDIRSMLTTPQHHAVCKVLDGVPDLRSIHWYYEKEGNWGKSFITRHYAERGACCVACEGAAHINYAVKMHAEGNGSMRTIIVDMPRELRTTHEFAGVVEKLKDGLIFNSKYASGQLMLSTVHLVMFANEPPPISFTNALSADRLRVVNLRKTPVYKGKFVLDEKLYPGVVDDPAYISTTAWKAERKAERLALENAEEEAAMAAVERDGALWM